MQEIRKGGRSTSVSPGDERATCPIAGRLRDAFHFHTDGIIFGEGEAANRFYLIVRGKVRLESSTLEEPVPIDEIRDGDLLGWSWLFPPYT